MYFVSGMHENGNNISKENIEHNVQIHDSTPRCFRHLIVTGIAGAAEIIISWTTAVILTGTAKIILIVSAEIILDGTTETFDLHYV